MAVHKLRYSWVIFMERLKMLREERKISQQKLAIQIGMNQQNIHRYENGFNEPDIHTLKLLANFFNTSVDYLVGNTDVRNKIEHVQTFDLNRCEARLMDGYRELPQNAQKGIHALLDALNM
jgi:transcriptional regulator with XRE-family HTH domain